MKEAAYKCGTCSGRNVDKAKEFDIGLRKSNYLTTNVVEDSTVVMECKVKESVIVNDHELFIAEAVHIEGEESPDKLYALNGYANIGRIRVLD